MKCGIEYKLQDHGWATVTVTDGVDSFSSPVSYLNDSLGELAVMAVNLKEGSFEEKAVFMDEPGELQLVVTVKNGKAFYEARWFNDWASWNMYPETQYEVVVSGECTPTRIVQQITTVLWEIHQNIGPAKYKELWINHEFPLKSFKTLANA